VNLSGCITASFGLLTSNPTATAMSCCWGLQDRLDGVNVVEDIVDEGRVQGEVYKNFEELDRVRHHYRVLVAKVAALTEDQAREIHIYAVGFWEGKRDG
jgi:hypothetical protein